MLGYFRPQGDLTSTDDEYPLGGAFDMIVWGVVVAGLPIVSAIYGLATGESPWPVNGSRWDLEGSHAVAICIGFISVGLFFHFHYFWGILKARLPFMLGRKLSLVLLVCCLGFVVFDIFRSFADLA